MLIVEIFPITPTIRISGVNACLLNECVERTSTGSPTGNTVRRIGGTYPERIPSEATSSHQPTTSTLMCSESIALCQSASEQLRRV